MSDNGIGDYFIDDVEDEIPDEDEDLVAAPVVVPVAASRPAPQPVPQSAPSPAAPPPVTAPPSESTAAGPQPVPPTAPVPAAPASPPAERPPAVARPQSREDRLAAALDGLIHDSPDIQAAALVSLDGFTMAAALPEGMHEDRVGAMSAAILGLGERAAAELGRGHLSQVFIEGTDGYVLLTAAGDRAVLTALAGADSKLGLIIYDMRNAAGVVAEILG